MIERDYIMRMITMLTAVIARLVQLKEARDYPRALAELQQQCRSLLGVDAEFLCSFEPASLSHLFGSDPQAAAIKCFAAGVLLKERSEVLALLEQPDDAAADRAQALNLLLEAYQSAGDHIDARHADLIEQLAGSIASPDDALHQRLLAYQESLPARELPSDEP